MDFDRWLADLEAKVADTQRKSAELMANLGTTTATVSSPDGAVRVTVGASGSLQNLELSARAAEHTPAQLGSLIMRTVHKAQRAVADRVTEELQPFDKDGQMLQRYVAYQPPPDPDELAEEPVDPDAINQSFGMADQAEPEAAPPAAQPQAPMAAPQAPAPTAGPPMAAPAPAPVRAAARPRRAAAVDDEDDEDEQPW